MFLLLGKINSFQRICDSSQIKNNLQQPAKEENVLWEQLILSFDIGGLPKWLSGKVSACQCRRHGFNPCVGKILWRRKKRHTREHTYKHTHTYHETYSTQRSIAKDFINLTNGTGIKFYLQVKKSKRKNFKKRLKMVICHIKSVPVQQ